MISQRCPKCFSKRIRRGYRPTPLWSKILFRYNLLCDSCNWEFTGFAVPGTVSAKPLKKAKKKHHSKTDEASVEPKTEKISEPPLSLGALNGDAEAAPLPEAASLPETAPLESAQEERGKVKRKRVKSGNN